MNITAQTLDSDSEFSMQFWEAQKDHFLFREQASLKGEAHKRVLALSKQDGWGWVNLLLTASNLEFCYKYKQALDLLNESVEDIPPKYQGIKDYLAAVACVFLRHLDEGMVLCHKCITDSNFDRPAYAWQNLGVALRRKGLFNDAMAAYKKALSFSEYDRPGNTWNSIGNLLKDKSQYDEALKAFNKALPLPKLISLELIWNNIALLYQKKGDLILAINAYKTALEFKNPDFKYRILNGLGTAYTRNGDFLNAIEAYQESLKVVGDAEDAARVWSNLGVAYKKSGNIHKAREAYLEALKLPDATERQHKRARLGLDLLDGKLKPTGLAPDDRALLEKSEIPTSEDTPEKRLISKISEAGGTKYDDYLKQTNSKNDNSLIVMRGWSSAMPLLEGSTRNWRGGGYFIKWRGYGLVIDPGFDFLRNMHDAKVHGREINVVVVSHNHPDHNYDFKAIDDLRYEIYRRRVKGTVNDIKPYVLLWDEDSSRAISFSAPDPEHLYTPIVLTAGYSHATDLTKHESRLPFRIRSFKVKHSKDVPSAMGVIIELLKDDKEVAFRLGYTGDTKYFEGLSDNLALCDLLIAHISQPDLEEFEEVWEYKEAHLGYRGVIELLKQCKPKMTLIGEFWAGFSDLRIDLVKGLRTRTDITAILPAGLGLHLNLNDCCISCTDCGKSTPFGEIRVSPPAQEYGNLGYLCPNCLLL